jgi:hypothetical protein
MLTILTQTIPWLLMAIFIWYRFFRQSWWPGLPRYDAHRVNADKR